MKDFKLLDLPLHGAHLIEASAGTGKTYTLASIFLRLVVEQGIGVDRILVVTFTKAATEELKTRIRQRLLTAKKSWFQEPPRDTMLAQMRHRIDDDLLAGKRIRDALRDFDRAAIFTIHGFCQRVLQHFAFETGHLFKSELVQDDAPYAKESAQDFWRRHIVSAPQEVAVHALQALGGPDELARILGLSRFPNVQLYPRVQKPDLTALEPWRRTAAKVKDQWPAVRENINQLLQYEGLNARKYGVIVNKKDQSGWTPRQIKMEGLCRAMDQWPGNYPLFKQFEMMAAHRLQLATKKGKTTPRHPFFDLCEAVLAAHDQLKTQLDAYVRYLKLQFFQNARSRMAQKKEHDNILFFDDLLLDVHRAATGPYGRWLADAVQEQYPVALVDEFQDTDQLQYEIFFRLFARDQSMLAMIGDPKQAIYSFRGADLFSYLRACQGAQTQTTLSKNWRAGPRLIQAVNALFENHPQPFGLKSIRFAPAVAARTDPIDPSPPLRLWYLLPDNSNGSNDVITATVAVPRIARAVANEVVRLLDPAAARFKPEDIAILVRTHHQAQIVKNALASKKVPAVLHSAGRIFDTRQAEEMERVLGAVANPTDPYLVRAALTSPMFGWDATQFLNSMDKENPRWQIRWEAFRTYQQRWMDTGFYAMFRRMMAQEGIKKRVLARPDGERALTNLLHLAELLHQAESRHHLGLEGLHKWLVAQRCSDEAGSDEQQLRLESDARAVRIITMHKSKGLQFKVVFCPYTWAGTRTNTQAAMFHNPDDDLALTLALGPGIPDAFQHQAQKEMLAENLRMLYVALTRARQRCYWVWGRIKGTDLSAPAYLLHGGDLSRDGQEWISPLGAKMAGLTHEQWLADIMKLVQRAQGSIDLAPLPRDDVSHYAPVAEPTQALACRVATRELNRQWRISSFSAMTAGHHAPALHPGDGDRESNLDAAGQASGGTNTLFDFHKGARAGLFFHDLLEHWDPVQGADQAWRPLVTDKLSQHGYEIHWIDPVSAMLRRLARVPLEAAHHCFAFKGLVPGARLHEMAFYFPLNPVDPSQMETVFQQHAVRPAQQAMARQMSSLRFAPMQGFMKGYMDLVFHHEGRYYLVDWKSNYLGPGHDHYAPAKLHSAMTDSYYFLQYHLYAVALDQWLRQRLRHYHYERHFGGVFYIYLRGLDDDPQRSNGIYYDLPQAPLIKDLNQLLIAGP